MKKTTSQKPTGEYPTVSFRCSKEEKARLMVFASKMKEINPFMNPSDVFRELIGLTNTGTITAEMRNWLSNPSASADEFRIDKVQKRKSSSEANTDKKKA